MTGTARHHLDEIRALGAADTEPDGAYDVILELVGGENLATNLERLALKGRIAVIGAGAGAAANVNFGYLMRSRGRIHGSTLRPRSREEKAEVVRRLREDVLPLLADGRVTVPVHETFPLERSAGCLRDVRRGRKVRQDRRNIRVVTNVLPENAESQRAWDGVLFDRFLHFKHLLVGGLVPFGAAAMRRFPPAEGARVVDLGCGFGDSTLALAELVGPSGSALGVDIAPRFVEAARGEARGVPNVRFEVMDVQATSFDETFDYAFARFGTMFFANPVAAYRNVRGALAPNGLFVSVVWRNKRDNPWMHVAEEIVKPLVPEPEETDEARCGPGPFSQANADTVTAQLKSAGLRRDHAAPRRPAAEDRDDARRGRGIQPRARAGSRGRSPRRRRGSRDAPEARGPLARGPGAVRHRRRRVRAWVGMDRHRTRRRVTARYHRALIPTN